MNLQLNHFKYRHQLIVFGLILGILPVLFLGILSYSTSSTIVQKKVNKTNLQILQQNELRVEEVLKSIQYYYLVLANSSTITKYLNVNLTYRDQDQVKELRQCLMGMQVAQPVLKNVYYINFSHNWVLVGSGEKPVTKQYDFHNLTAIIKDQRSFFWVCSPKEQDIIGYNRKTSSKPVDGINLIIKLPLNSNIPQGALIVNLQGSEFAKALIQKDRLDEMFLFDERGELILRDGKTRFTAAQIAAVSRAIKGKPENQGFYETHLAQRKVSISFRKSEYNGWIYVSVYDVSDITQDSRRIGWATLIICVIMILGVALVTFFGSTIFYTPIKNIFALLEKKTDIQVQDVQKEDNEFAYIEEGIATLITQRAEMNKQIQAQMFRLEELLLIKLVTGTFNRNNLDSKPEILGWVSSWKLMSIMAIQIDSCDNVKFVQNDREQLLLAVSDDVCNLIKKNCRLTPQIINKFLIVLVGTQDEDRPRFANYVQNCAGMIKNQVKEHLGIGVSIGIGRPFQDFYETPLAYKESIEALMCSIRFGEESIVHYEDVQSVKIVDSTVYPKEIEEDLLQAIHYGDTEVADKLLNEFIDNITSKQLSFAEYQVCFTRLLINIIIILQDSGESLHNIFNPHMRLFDELYSLTKPGEMKKWFIRSVIHPCLECLEQRRGNQYKHILDQVIQMVQQEYDTDLSLEICAERLNYHSSYIRRVLKKEMDITFSDYLANYRLAVAKRLLRESDLSVAEIAEKLRYHNPQNFIRYFKKLEGITPGQYREKFHLHS